MKNSQPPEWSKQFLGWLGRQPRWLIAIGVVLLLLIGALLLSDVSSPTIAPTGPGVAGDNLFGSTGPALGVFVRLILVVAAIYIAAILIRRWQTGNLKQTERRLALMETLHLSQRRTVYLVRAGEQVFLLGATDQAINLLGEVAGPAANEQMSKGGLSFDQHLSLASQKGDDVEDTQLP